MGILRSVHDESAVPKETRGSTTIDRRRNQAQGRDTLGSNSRGVFQEVWIKEYGLGEFGCGDLGGGLD